MEAQQREKSAKEFKSKKKNTAVIKYARPVTNLF